MGSTNQNQRRKYFLRGFAGLVAAFAGFGCVSALVVALSYPFAKSELEFSDKMRIVALERQVELLGKENRDLAEKTREIDARIANEQVLGKTELVAPGVREAVFQVQDGNTCRTLVKRYARNPATGMYDPAEYRSDARQKKGRCSA